MRSALCLGLVSVSLLSAVPLHARAQSPRPPVRANGPLADSLRAFALRMGDALRRLDGQAVFAFYGDTLHYVHVENGVMVPWSQLSAMMRTYFATVKSNPLSVTGEPGVTLVDRDNAVVYVAHHFGANEGQPAHDGVWTGVLHRTANGWRVIHSHSSERRP